MSLATRAYERSPWWLRDVLVTLYGAKLSFERYGRVYRAQKELFDRVQWDRRAEIERRQEAMLGQVLDLAARESPFYRERYRGITLPRRPSEIDRLPILDKETLRKNLDGLRTRARTAGTISLHTSGSTGTPMEMRFFTSDYQERMAVLDSYRGWFGVGKGDRRATFSGKVIKPPGDRSLVFWQNNHGIRQRLYSTYHMSVENLAHYVEDISAFRPKFIDGYPSALLLLARYLRARSVSLPEAPKVVFGTAETLTSDMRREMEDIFGCPVRNQYASSEGAPFVVECERGRNHFLSYTGVLEIIDSEGKKAREGRAIVTSFHNRFMPLIRFDIGDAMSWSDRSDCECGREYPLVETIVGREEDYIVTPSRGRVGRLDPVFKKTPPSIVRSQIVQEELGSVRVLYVPDERSFEASHLAPIEYELRARLGEDMRIDFERVSDIPLGPNGKFKAVVSKVEGGAWQAADRTP